MHQSTMFNRQQQVQQQAPVVELYDVNLIGPAFSNWQFGLGDPYDKITPQVCIITINEIQKHAKGGHPIRVGFFNIISENGFDNQMFQDLVNVIMMRVGYGMQAQEWRSMQIAVEQTVARSVKACGCSLALEDPEFMQTLKEEDRRAVKENADVWAYLMALATSPAGSIQFVPFSQMGVSSGLSHVAASTQSALEAARALRGQSGGGFVENFDSGVTKSAYNNNATNTSSRYGRRLEVMHGKVEGSMQEALNASGLTAPGSATAGAYASRIRRGNNAEVQAQAQAQAAPARKSFSQAAGTASKFDNDVTDFSRPMTGEDDVVNVETVAEPAKTLFTVRMDGKVIDIVAKRNEGFEAWKSSPLQRFHPAWCTRTHTVLYFETREGIVLAVTQELTDEQKDIAMEYAAHAIDPTKGKPDPKTPMRPVREEAKVLYQDASKVAINVIVSDKLAREEDVAGAIRNTRLSAELSETVPEAYVQMSTVNSPIVYSTAEDADEDLITIRAISKSADFAEAASYLPRLKNDMARQVLNTTLMNATKRVLSSEIGLNVRITGDFEENGPQIVPAITKSAGALIGEKLAAYQQTVLEANVRVASAVDMKEHADATLCPPGQEELSEAMLKRVLFLQHNVCVAWVNYTNDELAIGMPPKGTAPIKPDSLGGVYNIARTVYKDGLGSLTCAEQYLITKDSVCYRLHRGLVNKECYLLSKTTD